MLPFSLKVVWFALCSTGKSRLLCQIMVLITCVTGTFGCWVVLLAMSKSLNVYWITMLYCIATTALEGIFCLGSMHNCLLMHGTRSRPGTLGMLYRMDPFQMPEIFRLGAWFYRIIIAYNNYCMYSTNIYHQPFRSRSNWNLCRVHNCYDCGNTLA